MLVKTKLGLQEYPVPLKEHVCAYALNLLHVFWEFVLKCLFELNILHVFWGFSQIGCFFQLRCWTCWVPPPLKDAQISMISMLKLFFTLTSLLLSTEYFNMLTKPTSSTVQLKEALSVSTHSMYLWEGAMMFSERWHTHNRFSISNMPTTALVNIDASPCWHLAVCLKSRLGLRVLCPAVSHTLLTMELWQASPAPTLRIREILLSCLNYPISDLRDILKLKPSSGKCLILTFLQDLRYPTPL